MHVVLTGAFGWEGRLATEVAASRGAASQPVRASVRSELAELPTDRGPANMALHPTPDLAPSSLGLGG